MRKGKVDQKVLTRAIKDLDIDPQAPAPWTV